MASLRHENLQYTAIFSDAKIENFVEKKFDILNMFARSACSNDYPQSMFWIKNK